MKKYKILLACIKADFGEEGKDKYNDQGVFINPSWEWDNIYKPWKALADQGLVELETYWTDRQNAQSIDRLISISKDADLIFQVPVQHHLGIHLPQARQIIDGGTPIVSFHPDLHLRYKHPSGDRFVLSRVTEGYDTHTLSPAKHMMQTLADDGVKAYLMPFGIPDWCDRQLVDDDAERYDVTFVGQKHGIRDVVVSQLRGAGITVHTWGHFWSPHKDHHGRPTCSEMVNVFNQSKVNLNLRWCSRDPNYGQVKGRDMELMGCGAFMVASQHTECDDFHEMYTPDKEFAEYHLIDEMVEGIKYWLENDISRNAVAMNAYRKRQDNLWTTRLKQFLGDWATW